MDDVTFSRNGANTDTGHWRIIHRDSPGGAAAKSISPTALFYPRTERRKWHGRLTADLADFVVEEVELAVACRRPVEELLAGLVRAGEDDLRHEHGAVGDVRAPLDVERLERQRLRRDAGDERLDGQHGVTVHSGHADALPHLVHLPRTRVPYTSRF